jgi:hypothetical protein
MTFANPWRRLAAAFLLSAAACACSAPTQPAASTAPPSPAFEKAKSECTDVAVQKSQATNQQGIASKAAIGMYVECMEKRGFPGGVAR